MKQYNAEQSTSPNNMNQTTESADVKNTINNDENEEKSISLTPDSGLDDESLNQSHSNVDETESVVSSEDVGQAIIDAIKVLIIT